MLPRMSTFAVDIHIGQHADVTGVMGDCLTILPNFNGNHHTEIDFGESQSNSDHPCAAFWFNSRHDADKFREAIMKFKGIFSIYVGEKGVDF